MAKILFLQNFWYESPAIMALSASLKQSGHHASVAIGDTIQDFSEAIIKEAPDIIGFSLVSGYHLWGMKITDQIRAMELPEQPYIIFGGPHPTFFPDVLKAANADAICIGEGDYAIVELATCISQHKSPDFIQNLSVKIDGKIKTNPLRPLAVLDELPVLDRTIYYGHHKFFKKYLTRSFMTGRGCPFRCTFCYNAAIQNLYKGKGSFVRFRTPQNIIKEIAETTKEWGCRTVYFMDDTFALKKQWALELLDLYAKEIKLPFICKMRADTADEEVIAALKNANCRVVQFAIESANEKIRCEILKKQINDEDIYRTAQLLKKYKIKFLTYSMVGLPGESLEDVLDTIRMNAKIKG